MIDEDLLSAVVDSLGGRTIATAESCTAGRVAAVLASAESRGRVVSWRARRLPDVGQARTPGVSAVSVLSETAAREMAAGVCSLLGADVAVSTTGLAGPDAEDSVAPGTVFIGVSIDGLDLCHDSCARRVTRGVREQAERPCTSHSSRPVVPGDELNRRSPHHVTACSHDSAGGGFCRAGRGTASTTAPSLGRPREEDAMSNLWSYRETTWADERDLVGFDVEATDGSIGKIDEATYDSDSAYVVVDTGFWILGYKRLIPAGAVMGVDQEARKVMVNLTKEQIKSAPDYDVEHWNDEARNRHDDYYGTYTCDRLQPSVLERRRPRSMAARGRRQAASPVLRDPFVPNDGSRFRRDRRGGGGLGSILPGIPASNRSV